MAQNFLLITVDDMNYNSHEFLREGAEQLTPHLDRLRAEGAVLSNSHVTIALCQPSRSVMMTGRYPHRNGARGFEAIGPSIVTLTQLLHEHGYYNGIIGKENHIAPREKFFWDLYQHTYDDAHSFGRDPACYGRCALEFFQEADRRGKPFFLMANSHDPHRPFAGSQDEITMLGRHTAASRVYTEEEVEVPPFLPELPEIRTELAQYLTSVHRADEMVGAVLEALETSGHAEDTMVLFLSDNGMSMPFCKANCYLNSTKSPYLVRWPDAVRPGTEIDALVASIDYMPTILEIAGIEKPEGMDGTSLCPLLTGTKQEQYDDIYTTFFKTAKNEVTKAERHYPMRCVQTRQYAYIYNAWSDGAETYVTETMAGLTFQAMREAAKTDPEVARRVELYQLRVPEEFYDYQKDPHALHNLIHEPEFQGQIAQFRRRMLHYMETTGDELLEPFQKFLAQKGEPLG